MCNVETFRLNASRQHIDNPAELVCMGPAPLDGTPNNDHRLPREARLLYFGIGLRSV